MSLGVGIGQSNVPERAQQVLRRIRGGGSAGKRPEGSTGTFVTIPSGRKRRTLTPSPGQIFLVRGSRIMGYVTVPVRKRSRKEGARRRAAHPSFYMQMSRQMLESRSCPRPPRVIATGYGPHSDIPQVPESQVATLPQLFRIGVALVTGRGSYVAAEGIRGKFKPI